MKMMRRKMTLSRKREERKPLEGMLNVMKNPVRAKTVRGMRIIHASRSIMMRSRTIPRMMSLWEQMLKAFIQHWMILRWLLLHMRQY